MTALSNPFFCCFWVCFGLKCTLRLRHISKQWKFPTHLISQDGGAGQGAAFEPLALLQSRIGFPASLQTAAATDNSTPNANAGHCKSPAQTARYVLALLPSCHTLCGLLLPASAFS